MSTQIRSIPPPAPAFSATNEGVEGVEAVGRITWTMPKVGLSAVPAWLASLIVHLLIMLALAFASVQQDLNVMAIVALMDRDKDDDNIELDLFEPTKIIPGELAASDALKNDTEDAANVSLTNVDVLSARDRPSEKVPTDFSDRVAPKMAKMNASIEEIQATGFKGRGAGRRRELLKEGGGTPASEAAVALALKWLARHQRPDGSWNFDHTRGPGRRISPNPGSMRASPNAATAIALLPFLGAGQTHRSGIYQDVVDKGLKYLLKRQKRDGSWWEKEARTYSHGLAAICICEAYAMTQDLELQKPSQDAMDYIVRSQDKLGGGWRYVPGEAGDTSVLGWQLMALKSGAMAGLNIPMPTFAGVDRFLNSVSMEQGVTYGYDQPGRGDAVTAVGLLSRMYLGWPQDKPELGRGVILLAEQGPSDYNIYYNYYATQVVHHWGGELWNGWNEKLRPELVNAQVKTGDAAGSWFFLEDHGTIPGGRLYCTAMATMILEVYYRHMPIFRERAIEEEFPLVPRTRKEKKDAER